MNLAKHMSFFNPLTDLKETPIHVIGCGAIGSTVIEMLTRMGVPHLHIWDFDEVSPHNLANQMFYNHQIGQAKTDAIDEIAKWINPEIKLTHHKKWNPEFSTVGGYVFMAVDNIDLRREIVKANQTNSNIKAIFDFRMRLTDAQHYAANWASSEEQEKLLATMQFSHDEAKAATPVNACGTTLNIISTVRLITALGVANFINLVKEQPHKTVILADAFSGIVDVF